MWVHNATPEVNAASNYPKIVGVTISLCSVMVLTVITRLYVRVRTVGGIGGDDWAILAAALCSVVYAGTTTAQSRWGLGLPLALRPRVNLNDYSAVNYAGRPFYMMGILLFKVSLCFSYLRILSRGQATYRALVWSVMALCILAHLFGALLLIFNCQPTRKSWQPRIPGRCFPIGPLNYGMSGTTIAFDLIIFFLPIPFLYNLNMNKRKKIGIIGVFLVGLFTTVCSILRMTQIAVLTHGNGNSTMLVVWGNIEMNVGITLTCMPVLGPIFKVFGKKLTSYGKGTGYEKDPGHKGQSYNLQSFGKPFNNKSEIKGSTNISTNAIRYPDDISENESQESILHIDKSGAGNSSSGSEERNRKGIMRTVEVQVSTNGRCPGEAF